MSIFKSIRNKISEVFNKMFSKETIENTFRVKSGVSSEMKTAIELWADMYSGKSPWLTEGTYDNPIRVTSLGLPAMISSEKARTALLEFQSEITTPTKEVEVPNPKYEEERPQDEYGNILPHIEKPTIVEDKPTTSVERAKYLDLQYHKRLLPKLMQNIEYGIAKGGLIIKPYLVKNNIIKGEEKKYEYNIEFDFIQADNFYPLSFNGNDDITEAIFIQTKVKGEKTYYRVEYHKWEDNTVTIINKAFLSQEQNTNAPINKGFELGKEVPLSTVDEWKTLEPLATINDIQQPLFAYFKVPIANNIDTSSPLGISGFARAVDLIKDADMQYSRLLWEYEGGELAIDIDRDALRQMEIETTVLDGVRKETRTVLPKMQQRLFRKVELEADGDTYHPYAPTLRDTSYTQGLNTILMRIEDVCCISRGTLSDASNEARTATELKILKQRSFQENKHIQDAIQKTLEDVIYIMDAYCDMYNITVKGDYDVSFDFDDSLLTDYDTEVAKKLQLMQNGIVGKKEVRMWYMGETERQAEQALEAIREENNEYMEENLVEQSNMSRIADQVRNPNSAHNDHKGEAGNGDNQSNKNKETELNKEKDVK